MADCKKYNGSTWQHSLRKLDTATDTITTLPAVLYPTGTTATVGLKGNTVQSSTPTSDNPIMPQGTGERTGNLFDVNRQASNTWTIDEKYYIDGAVGDNKSNIRPDTIDASISNSGDLTVIASSYYGAGFVVAVTPNTTYTISFTTDIAVPSSKSIATITYVNADENLLNYITIYGGTTSVTFTTPDTAYYILITFRYINNTLTYSDIMLNLGSTPLPYEPYGIKIPISSASTTTPVYLGEVQTTRKIYKYEITGNETFAQSSNPLYYIVAFPKVPLFRSRLYSTHFIAGGSDIAEGMCRFAGSEAVPDGRLIFNYDNGAGGVSNFRSWVTQQYANGTPVTVWYVLATPETGIVNEPLMKIGDYADEVSNVSIPVTAGGDTISVGTTVQPSEVTANYKGWHPAIVHERENGAWT